MQFDTVALDLGAIDASVRDYRITTREDIEQLAVSIDRVGLLNPPILLPASGSYVVISGFRRIAACRLLAGTSIPARVIDPASPPKQCVQIAVTENAQQRALNLIETARALVLLSAHHEDPQALLEAASASGLPTGKAMIPKLLQLDALPEVIKQGILEESIALPIALALGRFDSKQVQAFGELFRELKVGLNKQRDILTWTTEIARRENVRPVQVLDDARRQAIVSEQTASPVRLKPQVLREYLHKRRYPNIAAFDGRFKEEVKQLKLGARADLKPPPGFEGTHFLLSLCFESLETLKEGLKGLDQLADNPALSRILSLKKHV